MSKISMEVTCCYVDLRNNFGVKGQNIYSFVIKDLTKHKSITTLL